MPPELYWLPESQDWASRLAAVAGLEASDQWNALVALANHHIDFVQTGRLDRAIDRLFGRVPPPGLQSKPLRVAILASSTVGHLLPGIRVGALRRGLWVEVYEGPYGQYWQELSDPVSGLHRFRPDVVLFSLDAVHLAGADGATVESALATMQSLWRRAREAFASTVVQQTVIPVFPLNLGNQEHRLAESRHWRVERLNVRLREAAAEEGVYLLSIDSRAQADGIREWYDPVLWHRAKQEIHPRVSHLYGDLLGRLLAAAQGRSSKCLVLDLDNTLWGGVIGDDGLDGILLGQGSAAGEAFVAFQQYVRDLARRGVILAVSSKNDEQNALAPFERHPEMILRRAEFACFRANWEDKASNLRQIARALDIGLDSLVFADDNPAERNLVRRELPMVQIPELPEDPSYYPACLSDAGYFEALTVTGEDRERTKQYRAHAEVAELRETSTDLEGFLRGLDMRLVWKPFDSIALPRIVQLINKTNQFNLTTRRYAEAEAVAMMADATVLTFQFRLLDRFGDNGIIAVAIGRLTGEELLLDTWLMSCRVLGRQVEESMLNVIASAARSQGALRMVGEYRPTAKNGMVRDHYRKAGFTQASEESDGTTRWALDLAGFEPKPTFISIVEATDARSADLQPA